MRFASELTSDIIGYIVPPFNSENYLYIDRNPDSDERAINREWTLVKASDVCVEKRTINTRNGIYKILNARIPGGGFHLDKQSTHIQDSNCFD